MGQGFLETQYVLFRIAKIALTYSRVCIKWVETSWTDSTQKDVCPMSILYLLYSWYFQPTIPAHPGADWNGTAVLTLLTMCSMSPKE